MDFDFAKKDKADRNFPHTERGLNYELNKLFIAKQIGFGHNGGIDGFQSQAV